MRLIAAAAAGIGLAYFFDPQSGRRRRHGLRDRTFGLVRRAVRRVGRAGRSAIADVEGAARKAAHLREQRKPDLTDETITAKILSEVFRDPELPKGHVNVNVEGGVAVLRGTVGRLELIDQLVSRVQKVQGVREVASLLHVEPSAALQRS
jgi:osmotically-inducible protein OsmY